MFVCIILHFSQVQVEICLGNLELLSLRLMSISLSTSSISLRPSVIVFSLHILYTYTDSFEKLSLQSSRKRRQLDELLLLLLFLFFPLFFSFFFLFLFFVFRSILILNPALPFWKLAFVFLPAILRTSHCLVFVPLINTVLLGAPTLPMRWVKTSTYLQ
jgi:hypothetical protein